MHACMYECTHVRKYACTHVRKYVMYRYVRMYAYVHMKVCTHVLRYVRTYVCMDVYKYRYCELLYIMPKQTNKQTNMNMLIYRSLKNNAKIMFVHVCGNMGKDPVLFTPK